MIGNMLLLLIPKTGPMISLLPLSAIVIALSSLSVVIAISGNRLRAEAIQRINRVRLKQAKNRQAKKDQLLFLKCTNMIRAKEFYLNGKYTIEELADDINSNKTYISRAINTQTGMTYPQYLNKLRIEYALDLIKKDPYMPLSEVSYLSGFAHQSAFTDSFKRNVGVTPRAYLDSVMYLRNASSFVESSPQTAECPSMMKEEAQSDLSQFS